MSTSERKKLISYKQNIQGYLLELRELCLEPPLESKLLSLDATEQIRVESQYSLERAPARKIRMNFEEKKKAKFKGYVIKLHQKNPGPVYIWTEKSNSCGLYEIPSLLNFNFDFEFNVNKQGIISILAADLTDNVVLDFSYDESSSKYELEIDVCGDHWPTIDY